VISRGRAVRSARAAQIGAGLALLAVWWVTLAPTVLGGPVTYVVIRGDSMLPTFESGDLVLVRTSASYAVGDAVAYRVPEGELGAGRLVLHRIVDAGVGGLVMQGDNNPAPDPWRPGAADVAGAAWLRLPSIGRVVALLHQPAVAAALAAAIVVWIVVLRWGPGRPSSTRGSGESRRRYQWGIAPAEDTPHALGPWSRRPSTTTASSRSTPTPTSR
jgi:signal peptidase I